MKKHVVVLSGAGISAESGIATFRASDGTWENHRVEDVATPEAFARNPQLVLDFYNERRAQLLTVAPNAGHRVIAELEADYRVSVVTQNVDDLHERAGSSNVIHLHGELLKVRPVDEAGEPVEWRTDLTLADADARGVQLRPHIVWFGEAVPMLEKAADLISRADAVVIVGTSLQVYPAAALFGYAPPGAPLIYVDPAPNVTPDLRARGKYHLVERGGGEGMPVARDMLRALL